MPATLKRQLHTAFLVSILLSIMVAQASALWNVGVPEGEGLGGAYTTLALSPEAMIYNPAGLGLVHDYAGSLSGSRLAWGIGRDYLADGTFLLTVPLLENGTGGAFENFQYSDRLQVHQFGLAFGYQMLDLGQGLSLQGGLTTGLLVEQYTTDAFEGTPGNDLLFQGQTTALRFNADAGVLLRQEKGLSFALVGQNLARPNLALRNQGNGRLDPTIRLGMSYTIRDYVTPVLEVIWGPRSAVNSSSFRLAAGVQAQLLDDQLRLRAGGDRDRVLFGLSFSFSGKLAGIGLDYAFELPLSTIGDAGLYTHRLGLSFHYAKPKLPKVDLFWGGGRNIEPGSPIVGEPVTIRASLWLVGPDPVSAVIVTPQVDRPQYAAYFQPRLVENLLPDQPIVVEWSFVPLDTGRITLTLRADDDGSRLPQLHGQVNEVNEENNLDTIRFQVTTPLTIQVTATPSEVPCDSVRSVEVWSAISREMRFAAGEARLDPSSLSGFPRMAALMQRNPAVRLVCFVAGTTDSLLAQRKRTILSYLSLQGLPPGRVRFRSDETRRDAAAFVPELVGELSRTIPLQKSEYAGLDLATTALSGNPDLLALIRLPANAELSARFRQIRQDFAGRVLVTRYPAGSTAEASLTLDPVLIGLGGQEMQRSGIAVRPEPLPTVALTFATESPGLDSFVVDLVGGARRDSVLTVLRVGWEELPSRMEWNWRTESGRLIPPNEPFHIRVRASVGQRRGIGWSAPLRLVPRSETRRRLWVLDDPPETVESELATLLPWMAVNLLPQDVTTTLRKVRIHCGDNFPAATAERIASDLRLGWKEWCGTEPPEIEVRSRVNLVRDLLENHPEALAPDVGVLARSQRFIALEAVTTR